MGGIYKCIKKIGQFTKDRPGEEPRISRSKITTGSTRFPAFYGYDAKSRNFFRLWCLEAGVCVVFGAVHCTGWGLTFHSDIVQLLWRISAALITGIPALGAAFGLLLFFIGFLDHSGNFKSERAGDFIVIAGLLALILMPALLIIILMYVAARGVLVVLACMDMAHLTLLAHKTPEWADFIPHI